MRLVALLGLAYAGFVGLLYFAQDSLLFPGAYCRASGSIARVCRSA